MIIKYDNAIQCYDKAIKLDSNDSDAYSCKDSALLKLNRYDEAVICFDKAIHI